MKYDFMHIGRRLAYLLRHHPEAEGLTIDKNGGWVDVDKLLLKLDITLDELKQIVALDGKCRFSFEDESYRRIRANQGHSIKVDLELQQVVPPAILYHGTAKRFLGSILQNGITRKSRHHVHLSKDKESAVKVGQRHGKPIVIKINSDEMNRDGISFYLSANDIYLTEHVNPIYFEEIIEN